MKKKYNPKYLIQRASRGELTVSDLSKIIDNMDRELERRRFRIMACVSFLIACVIFGLLFVMR